MAISYTDGSEIESHITKLLEKAATLNSNEAIAAEEYNSWPVRYHLGPERANLLRHLDFSGLDVCELGAGMGGVSRFLAENAKTLTAVEGSEARYAALCQRLRDMTNWTGVVKNLQDFTTDRRFDVVCLIGVLEYSQIYIDHPEPFLWVLRHAFSLLKDDGVLLLAIENQLGLKYWAGAPEDHTGRMYDGIAGYPAGKSPRTFSRSGLMALLRRAGYERIEEFYPWPDYKTPLSVVHRRMLDAAPQTVGEVALGSILRMTEGEVRLLPEALATSMVAAEGLLDGFANSFLFAGAKKPESTVLARLMRATLEQGEVGWHYSAARRSPTRTTFRLTDSGIVASKSGDVPTVGRLRWCGPLEEPLLRAPLVSTLLYRYAYFGDRNRFDKLLDSFLTWAFDTYGVEGGLCPTAVDITTTNTVMSEAGFKAFDIEWEWDGPVTRSWFVLRVITTLRYAYALFPEAGARTLADLYESLCQRYGVVASLREDIAKEASFQASASVTLANSDIVAHYQAQFEAPIPRSRFPRDPAVEAAIREGATTLAERNRELEAEVARLRVENHNLGAELTRKAVRIALLLDRGVRKVPGAHTLGRILARSLRRRPDGS